MDNILRKELITYLSSFISEEKNQLFQRKIKERSRHLTIVLEDVFQSRNISAAMRSADCFGLQDVHIIENRNNYNTHPNISLGSGKWLTQTFYNKKENNTENCLKNLKKDGYRIIATSPHKTKSIHDIDIKKGKIALLFGAEQEGLSPLALEMADEKVKIPMYGFTESYNISVAVALCIQAVISKIREYDIAWQLSEKEKDEVMLNWLRSSVKESELIEKRFIQEIVIS